MRYLKKVVLGFLFTVIFAAQVFAHAHLLNADPAKNAVVREAPKQVTLKFSEDLETALCKVQVTDLSSGTAVSSGKLTNGGQGESTLQLGLTPLKPAKATYQVKWKAVSKDSHKMEGSYQFTYDPKKK